MQLFVVIITHTSHRSYIFVCSAFHVLRLCVCVCVCVCLFVFVIVDMCCVISKNSERHGCHSFTLSHEWTCFSRHCFVQFSFGAWKIWFHKNISKGMYYGLLFLSGVIIIYILGGLAWLWCQSAKLLRRNKEKTVISRTGTNNIIMFIKRFCFIMRHTKFFGFNKHIHIRTSRQSWRLFME